MAPTLAFVYPPDLVLVFPEDASPIVHRTPDRAGQERAAQLHRRLRSTKPVGMTALGLAAIGFVVAPAHPVSIALYVLAAVGLITSFAMLQGLGSRICLAERSAGLPVPADVADAVVETHRHLGYLDEEVTYWRRQPGAPGLRRRVNREIDAFQAQVRDIRRAWLRGDDERWRQAGRAVSDLLNGLDDLSVEVSRLPSGGRGLR